MSENACPRVMKWHCRFGRSRRRVSAIRTSSMRSSLNFTSGGPSGPSPTVEQALAALEGMDR